MTRTMRGESTSDGAARMRGRSTRGKRLSLSHRDAPFQQEGADLIDDAGALADQPLTDAMQSL